MKIGLVCPYGVDRGGGVLEVVYAIQAVLNKRGHDAYLITPRPQTDDFQQRDKTIFIGSATDVKMPSRTTIQMSASQLESVDAMLDEHKFDVLHFNEPWVPLMSYQLLSRSRCANVGTFHANVPPSGFLRALTKAAAPWAKLVVKDIHAYTAVSEAAAEQICKHTAEPVAIIPNGIDMKRFKRPRKIYDGRKDSSILYVSRLEGRKGVKYLLHAFAELQLHRPDVRLVLVGDGPDREKLEELATELELRNVQFLGYVTTEKKIALYQESDLFCAPSLYGESFGVVLLEAMASGLVTVAGDNPGYASVLKGLGSISLVDPKHTAEFARRLELLLYETDLRKLWRNWAVAELPQYSYDHIVAQYEEVYKKAIKARALRVG